MDVAKRRSRSSWPGTSTSYAHLIWCWLIRAWHKYLVGGWPTPLKNVSESQLGWWNSQDMESHKMHVPVTINQILMELAMEIAIESMAANSFRGWMCTVSITVSNADQTVAWCLSHSRKKCGDGHVGTILDQNQCRCRLWNKYDETSTYTHPAISDQLKSYHFGLVIILYI